MATTQILPGTPRDRVCAEQASPTGSRAARERALLRRVHLNRDPRARDQLAEDLLPLARALAARYANRGEPLDDLVQVASVGIMKAIDGFDLACQVRLSSYATPVVLGEIKRHFRDKTWAIRVPRPLQELHLRVAKARDKLTHELGRAPVVQEIADTIDASLRDVAATIESAGARRARSLDEPAGEDRTLADSLGAVDPEIERAEMRTLLDGALDVLSDRDRGILLLRFEDDLSQADIAQRVGVSQMQVSRLIRQSLARVRLQIERSPERKPMIAACQTAEQSLPAPIRLPVRKSAVLGLRPHQDRIAA
jgi:RNA polymerase sigma-B factor